VAKIVAIFVLGCPDVQAVSQSVGKAKSAGRDNLFYYTQWCIWENQTLLGMEVFTEWRNPCFFQIS